ncbi:VOC family protein [uncultured Sphingomonas sp.]|uniref:VOC family protein n=1 Tax=uncultured Sphingomonas sp. TaxID=158754 RepID=UPI002627D6BF|nr:VOC family protein [uncultured Sphingomonas sp.]
MTHAPRRIDHLVVAVHDLDAAGLFYEKLGFQVGTRNRHPWGTENRLIQFGNSFIELITVGPNADAIPDHAPGRFSFGAFVRDYLSQREGLAMLVLNSEDAKADAARFAHLGIGAFEPFYFERKGQRPDGSEMHVAFTLAFAAHEKAPRAGFFVCQQHFPENFWNAAFQRHANGASGIIEVGMAASDPQMYREFLSGFSGGSAEAGTDGLSFKLHDGSLRVTPDSAGNAELQLCSFAVRVPDLGTEARRLLAADVSFTANDRGLSIGPETAFGLSIRFEDAERRQ